MSDSAFLALFVVGLLGGTHCFGMCGGIVGALSLGAPPRWSLHLGYSAGRIASYAAAGALAGALGSASLVLEGQLPVRLVLYVLANLMLVALGLYLTGFTGVLVPLESAGAGLWRRLQPLTTRFLPVRTVAQAIPLGALWGWLPCGLVYSALASALTAGSAGRGALMMAAFGMGTLPNLLLAGFFVGRLGGFMRLRSVRLGSGILVMGFGLWGLASALRTAMILD